MNLKESIISSFFFHLILFLLVTAAVNYTAGFPGGTGKIIPVELTMERSEDQPAFTGDAEEELPGDFKQPADEKMDLPEQDISTLPKEPETVPEPEKKTEPKTEPATAEHSLPPPIRTEGFTSMEAYYQFIILHKKIFAQKAGAKVNELLGEAFKVNKRQFYGGTAIVSLAFGTDGTLKELHVDSASPDLKAFFEEIDWSIVPPPAAYSLGYTAVQIEFTVLEGYMNFRINTR